MSRRERLRYWLDNLLSHGLGVLVIGLLATTGLVVVSVSALVVLVGWAGKSGFNFLDTVWRALLTTIDSGTVGNFTGGTASPGFLLALFGVTLAGIFVTSIFIGILVTAIQARLEVLRKGRSRVVESGHTVILGWSLQVFAVIAELVVANANQRRRAIVVLAPRDKVEMEDEIRARVGHFRRTRLVCRTGSPIDIGDLRVARIDTAKAVVILAPSVDDPDMDVIKTILAITNNPGRRDAAYHLVAEIRESSSLDVARIVGGAETQLVVTDDLIARITAQTCRQSGLSTVYTQLLEFEGDAIYDAPAPSTLVGRSFGDTLLAYDDSSVIGLVRADDGVRLNPPMSTVLKAGDRLVAISRDDDTVQMAARPVEVIHPDAIVGFQPHIAAPERTLILGWNRRGAAIVRELDPYVASGSQVVVRATPMDLASASSPGLDATPNSSVDIRLGDPTDRPSLAELCAEGFDHVIVLCSDVLDPQRSDARTLITLIHLRDIIVRNGHQFSITSEMLDLRNRALAEVTRADDFIVSDRLASLLLGQLAENRHLKGIFDNLFDRAGSEIFLRPASEYVRADEALTFATVVESARRRGEIALGYRQQAAAADASRAYGIVINPPKSSAVQFATGDRVIVLAEGTLREVGAATTGT